MKGRTLLMIPGPIEFEPEVMAAMSMPTTSHVAPEFIETFGQALDCMKDVFLSPDGQPIVLAGSGTLAMDMAGANLIEPGDRALVVNTGYFGDRFGALLERYGAQVTQVRAPIGGRPGLEEIEAVLRSGSFKLMTVTHVDTSTGVITDIKAMGALAQQYGPLLVVDGVCSVAAEELRMTEWGVDLAITASQKAIGVPPGLAMLVARPRAIAANRARKSPVLNFYADWNNWLSCMEAYQARRAAYFGTPPINLIYALNVSLRQILAEGMEARFARHQALGAACQRGIAALGLGQVPVEQAFAAHTMTAARYPQNISAASLLPKVQAAGVILAGGLHAEIKNEYFRIGHMGACRMNDLLATMGALEAGLSQCGHAFRRGAGVAAVAGSS